MTKFFFLVSYFLFVILHLEYLSSSALASAVPLHVSPSFRPFIFPPSYYIPSINLHLTSFIIVNKIAKKITNPISNLAVVSAHVRDDQASEEAAVMAAKDILKATSKDMVELSEGKSSLQASSTVLEVTAINFFELFD